MASNGHLERAGEAPFARTRAAGWDTRWGTAGPGTSCTSWVHQEAHPQLLLGGECPNGHMHGRWGPAGYPGRRLYQAGGEAARLREAERLKPPARASFAAQSEIC